MLRYRWHRNTITDGDRSHTVVRRVEPGSKAGNDGGADSTTVALRQKPLVRNAVGIGIQNTLHSSQNCLSFCCEARSSCHLRRVGMMGWVRKTSTAASLWLREPRDSSRDRGATGKPHRVILNELLDLGGSIGGPQNTQREVIDSSFVSDLDDRAPGLVQEDDPSYSDLIALVNRPTLICHHGGHERNHEMLFQIDMPCAKRGEQIMRLGTVHDLSNAPSLFSQTQPAILGFKRCNGGSHVLSTVAFCSRKHIVGGETHGCPGYTPFFALDNICWRQTLQRQAIPLNRESVLLVFESDEAPLPTAESHASCRISDARLDHQTVTDGPSVAFHRGPLTVVRHAAPVILVYHTVTGLAIMPSGRFYEGVCRCAFVSSRFKREVLL